MASVDQALARLTERAKARRRRREAEAGETRSRVLQVLARQLPPGGEAWLIGSLAWGGFGERSDVDVVVRGLSSDSVSELERSLSEATGVEVDLLDLSSLTEPFRARVLAEGILVRGV